MSSIMRIARAKNCACFVNRNCRAIPNMSVLKGVERFFIPCRHEVHCFDVLGHKRMRSSLNVSNRVQYLSNVIFFTNWTDEGF